MLAAGATAGLDRAGIALEAPPGASLVGGLVALVRRLIIGGEVAAGSKLNEHALSQRLGVSRSALREAVRLLEPSGLIVIEPNRGVFVRRISLKEALDLFDVRAGLARTAGGLAAVRASQGQLDSLASIHANLIEAQQQSDFSAYYDRNLQFHAELFAATGNERLGTLDEMMSGELQLFRRRNLGNAGQLNASVAEHRRILDAIAARDPARAARAFERHVITGRQRMLDTLGPDGTI